MPPPDPPLEPFAPGLLDAGHGRRLYRATCARSEGRPAVALDARPGSCCTLGARRLFDPQAYRVVVLYRRGAGRSTAHAADPGTDLSVDTTEHLIADGGRLRAHLGIDRRPVHGTGLTATARGQGRTSPVERSGHPPR